MTRHLPALLLVVVLVGTPLPAAENPPSVSLFSYEVGMGIPKSMALRINSRITHHSGTRFSLLIEGRDIIGLGERNLAQVLSRDDGRDLLKELPKLRVWGWDSQPHINSDRRYAITRYSFKPGPMVGRLEGCTVVGSIDVLRGSEQDLKKSSTKLTQGTRNLESGLYRLSLQKTDESPELTVEGDLTRLKEILIKQTGRKTAFSSRNEHSTIIYRLSSFSLDPIEVRLSYWEKVRKVPVPFRVVVGDPKAPADSTPPKAPSAVASKKPSVRLLSYYAGVKPPRTIDRRARPMADHVDGIKVSLVVEGDGLLGFAKAGYKLTNVLRRDGKVDYLPRLGEERWRWGEEEIHHKRKAAVTSIVFHGRSMIGRIEGSTLKGSVTIRSGNEENVKTTAHKVKIGGKDRQAGPFELQTRKPDRPGQEAMVGVKGELGLLRKVLVRKDGKAISENPINWFGSIRSVDVPAKEGAEVEVVLTYLDNLVETPLPFEIVVGVPAK